jgi:Amt family ammonium transporter
MFAIWFLIGAALVFFMQCGFAMVESGFTRAKNAGNIIMKNLMDFCLGTVAFIVLGSSLMLAEDYVAGVIGVPNLDYLTSFQSLYTAEAGAGGYGPLSNFVFNLVFCATAATIVSGAMAERTKFSTYCLYSVIISLVVYPIEAGWVWNSQGWLAQLGYIDFAGSSAIHMVGGISALIGAIFLGPRIGKYERDKNGKVTKVNDIGGHSIVLGALGVFILWFGWYGFNGAACTSIEQLAQAFFTTTIAPAIATVVTLIITWARDGKPDVGMCLNGSLAGLVAITAPCVSVDGIGAIVIGAVAGVLVYVATHIVDHKLHIDDPVGAFAVHGVNGIWGTLATGLFATEGGLFYGGGIHQFAVQALGVGSIALYTIVVMTIVFFILKKTIGIRVPEEEELEGLDMAEHGLRYAYADFASRNSYKKLKHEVKGVEAEVSEIEENLNN